VRKRAGLVCLVVVALAAALGSCGEDAQIVARQVRDFISNVQTGDGQARGALVQGAAPGATPGGPQAGTNVPSANIITGGTTGIVVSGDVEFASVIIIVGGAEDYYEVILPNPTSSAEILLTFAEDVPLTNFDCAYSFRDTNGNIARYASTAVTARSVPSGDVQVTVTWDAPSDIDLAVLGPDEQRIWFDEPEAANGARLTVDSNAGCDIDNINTESITYPRGRAPSGTYVVEVRQFSSCSVLTTNFTVTVLREGTSEPIIRRGSFSGVSTEVPQPPTGSDGEGEARPPGTGQTDPNLFTFTFEFPPRGGTEQCPSGQVRDPESGQCRPAQVCGAPVSGGEIGQSCEVPGAACAGGAGVCSGASVCTSRCDLACGNQECGGALPICAQDETLGEAVCRGEAVQRRAETYEACGVTGEPADCASGSDRCLRLTGLEATAKPFCSPACVENTCPAPGGDVAVTGSCALGEGGSETPTRCVVLCDPETPVCLPGQRCQPVSGGGVCIWPLSAAPSP
jgi:hypothetical protein